MQQQNHDNFEQRIASQIKEQMTKAYFNLIDETINSEKPDHEWLTKLYIELRDRLLQFVKKDSRTYKQIIEDFDVELFHQMITNDVFDGESLHKLVNNSFNWVMKLQAPVRDTETQEAMKRVLSSEPAKSISSFLKEIHTCIDTLEVDMNNYFEIKKSSA
jgi:T-complex protein 11